MLFTKFPVVASILLPVGLLALGAGAGALAGRKPGAAPPSSPPAQSGAKDQAAATRPGDPATATVAAAIDAALAKAVDGRIVRASTLTKDNMVLSYIPEWSYGNLDNIGLTNSDGGVRTIVDWPKVAAEEAKSPDRRFLLAFYSRKTTAAAKAGPILAFEVADEWVERTSWKTQPDYAAEPFATYPFQPGEGWKLFDITTIVRARIEDGRPQHGIILRFQREDLRGVEKKWSEYQMVSREGDGEWAARRPQLLVVEPTKR